MAGPTFQFGAGAIPEKDGRLDAPAFHRNHAAIWSVLSRFLAQQSGDVLEIGSGTGQHIVTFALNAPQITWWPSDLVEAHRRSILAWIAEARLTNVRPPVALDLTAPAWALDDHALPQGLLGILCANVLHIAPWSAAEGLFAGIRERLAINGRLFLYGPFKRAGMHTAESNAAFDASLRARNPEWGVRDTEDCEALARAGGMTLEEIVEMPANNLILVLRVDATG